MTTIHGWMMTGVGEPLIGRLLLYDALAMEYRTFTLKKDPSCPVCGDSPSSSKIALPKVAFMSISRSSPGASSGIVVSLVGLSISPV